MHDAITLETLSGAALLPHLDTVAQLRIAVFRDWPKLCKNSRARNREVDVARSNNQRCSKRT